jgi:hypothetical protein
MLRNILYTICKRQESDSDSDSDDDDTEDEQNMVDWIKQNQTCLKLVVFSKDKPNACSKRIIHPDMAKMYLAKSELKSQKDVKTCRFWEKLRFTDCYEFQGFMEDHGECLLLNGKCPHQHDLEDLKFYWYNSYEGNESWCGTCNDDIPRMKDTLDQYTPIPTNEVPEILALIKQHLEDEIPKPIPLPLKLNLDSKLAQDNPVRVHQWSVFMGQLLRSTNPIDWFADYADYGCSLVPYGDHYYALLVDSTLHHLAPDESMELSTDMASWKDLQKHPRINEWNRQFKNERQINGQLHKDGFDPIVPLFVESVSLMTLDGERQRTVFTNITVLPIDETEWVMGKVASSLYASE